MPGTIAVGLDGSPESRAAAEWAAREAALRRCSTARAGDSTPSAGVAAGRPRAWAISWKRSGVR
ncbi:nucleotide-binding universal stress UspA family protein [Streptomyces sp. B3I7]|nr:nucleotide-binding universal stress UspA family protein [Streptomyces sp. B3I7]